MATQLPLIPQPTPQPPTFRRSDIYQVLAIRDFLRQIMPPGSEGFVAEDLDLVCRTFGARFQTDGKGRIALFELKYGKTDIGIAQRKTFGLMDQLMRIGDPDRKRYLGYYVLNYSSEDWYHNTITVCGKLYVTLEEKIALFSLIDLPEPCTFS